MRKRFGEVLLERGLINQAQLDDALAYQARRGVRLGAALVARGHLEEGHLVEALGEALRVPVVSLRGGFTPDPAALKMVSLRLCSEHDLFPYAVRQQRGRNVLTVATSDPLNFRLLDELGFMTNASIEAVLAPASDIDLAIRKHYGPRLGRAYQDDQVRLALQEDEDGSEMTIYRRGGGVEVINTKTGQGTGDLPPKRTARPREDSALLLTDEVDAASAPTERPIPLTRPKSPPSGPPPLPPPTPVAGSVPPTPTAGSARPPARAPVAPQTSSSAPIAPQPAPVAPMSFGGPAPEVPTAPMTSEVGGRGFDDAIGALIDQATEQDHAEANLRLERKFWALMRVLAKKGLLTNEDFLAELGEEEKWRR